MNEYGIRLERTEKLAMVIIDRPVRMNAFNERMFTQLETITAGLTRKPPRAVIITGAADRAFSAGFDVNPDNPMNADMLDSVEQQDKTPAERCVSRVRDVVDKFVALPVPIIAAVNGLAYGGGAELATRCDLRVMDPGAVICFSEVRLGLMPDWGGGPTLVRLVGPSRAADLILTARRIGADEAFQIGLANRISRPGEARTEAVELARQIAANGPRAVIHALHVIRKSREMPLHQALDLEAEQAVSLIVSGEYIHGVSAFLEKKPAEFPDVEPDEGNKT